MATYTEDDITLGSIFIIYNPYLKGERHFFLVCNPTGKEICYMNLNTGRVLDRHTGKKSISEVFTKYNAIKCKIDINDIFNGEVFQDELQSDAS